MYQMLKLLPSCGLSVFPPLRPTIFPPRRFHFLRPSLFLLELLITPYLSSPGVPCCVIYIFRMESPLSFPSAFIQELNRMTGKNRTRHHPILVLATTRPSPSWPALRVMSMLVQGFPPLQTAIFSLFLASLFPLVDWTVPALAKIIPSFSIQSHSPFLCIGPIENE